VRLAAEVEHRGPVRVIRFEAQAPHPHQADIDAAYRVANPPAGVIPTEGMNRLMEAAGIPTHPGQVEPSTPRPCAE
jgi:hypothetical protein